MKKEKTKTFYKNKLDAVFSRYIRKKYEKDDRLKCYTCNFVGTVKNMQCGHFVPRQHMSTRWDEDNCRPQCMACNMFYNGQPSTFATNLEKEKQGLVQDLEERRKKIRQWTIDDIKKEIFRYERAIMEDYESN